LDRGPGAGATLFDPGRRSVPATGAGTALGGCRVAEAGRPGGQVASPCLPARAARTSCGWQTPAYLPM